MYNKKDATLDHSFLKGKKAIEVNINLLELSSGDSAKLAFLLRSQENWEAKNRIFCKLWAGS